MVSRKNKKLTCCELCGEIVQKGKPDTILSCVWCHEIVHKSCANEENLIAKNGAYYCDAHREHAPQFDKRNGRGAPATVTSEAQAQIDNALANLSQQIQAQAEIVARNSILSSIANQQLMNPNFGLSTSHTNYGLSTLTQEFAQSPNEARMPNVMHATCPDPPLAPKCFRCNTHVIGDSNFFKCCRCSAFAHNKCIDDEERLHAIDDYWACVSCVRERIKKRIILDPPPHLRNNEELGDRRSLMFANMRLNDTFFTPQDKQERLLASKVPDFSGLLNFTIPVPEQDPRIAQNKEALKALTSKYKLNQAPQAEAAATSSQQNAPNKRAEQPSELSSIMKLIQSMKQEQDRFQEEIYAKIGIREQNPIPPPPTAQTTGDQSTPVDAQAQRQNERPRPENIILNPSLGASLEESIRVMANQGFVQANLLNQKMMEMQIMENRRNTHRVLPKVTQPDYEWKIFYKAFLETHELFSQSENISRLQEAIQCEKIKSAGGHNLFNPETFLITLINIDERIGKPGPMLLNEKRKLMEAERIKSNDNQGLVKLIDKITSYSNLVDKLGVHANKTDLDVISRLSRLLPKHLSGKWSDQFNRLTDYHGEVTIKDMAQWLNKQIRVIETDMMFEKMDPYGTIKVKGNRHDEKQESKDSKRNKKERLFLHAVQVSETESEEEEQEENAAVDVHSSAKRENPDKGQRDSKDPGNYCWYHDKEGHSSLYCFSLLKMSGKEVTNLAKEKNICTICSRESHFPCPYRSRHVECLIPGCYLKHASIFCFKRIKRENRQYDGKQYKRDGKPQKDAAASQNAPKAGQSVQHTAEQAETTNMHVMQQERTQNSFVVNALHGHSSAQSTPSAHTSLTLYELELPTNESQNELKNNLINLSTQSTSRSLQPAVVIKLKNESKELCGAFLLDSGSSVSMIEKKYADMLNVKGVNKPLCIEWSGGKTRVDDKSEVVHLKGHGIHRGAQIKDIFFRTMENLALPKQVLNLKEMRKRHEELKNYQLESYSQIIGIIGEDQKCFLKQFKWIDLKGNKNSNLSIILTPLGYAMMGNECQLADLYYHLTNVSEITMQHSVKTEYMPENEEAELIKMQDSVKSVEHKMPYANDRQLVDEEISLKILNETVRKIPDANQYETGLLWKEINEQIRNLESKNRARQATWPEIQNPPINAFYTPSFISNPMGNRIRLVWDAGGSGCGELSDISSLAACSGQRFFPFRRK